MTVVCYTHRQPHRLAPKSLNVSVADATVGNYERPETTCALVEARGSAISHGHGSRAEGSLEHHGYRLNNYDERSNC